MPEMSQQFDFWGGSAPLGSTRTVPVPGGDARVVPPTKRAPGKRPEQLPMFMSAREIDETTYPGDLIHHGPGATEQDRSDLRSYKRGEAVVTDAGPYGNGQENLSQSIRRQGVQRPIDIGHGRHGDAKWVKQPIVLNGNTRLSTALALNPDQLVPVVHHKNPRQGLQGHPDWAERVPEAFGWRDRF